MERKIFGVHHIALKACGLAAYEKTIEFYHNILGMPVVRTWGEGENVGTMLDIGMGRKPADAFRTALETGNRLALGITAPASGLELTHVYYADEEI